MKTHIVAKGLVLGLFLMAGVPFTTHASVDNPTIEELQNQIIILLMEQIKLMTEEAQPVEALVEEAIVEKEVEVETKKGYKTSVQASHA